MTEKLVRLSRTNRRSKVQRDACLPNSKRQFQQQRKQRQRQCRLKIHSNYESRENSDAFSLPFTVPLTIRNIPNNICKTTSNLEEEILEISRRIPRL